MSTATGEVAQPCGDRAQELPGLTPRYLLPRMGGVAIVVFSDLVDSTALLARLGDDRMEQLRRAHVEDVSDAVAGGAGGWSRRSATG